MYASMAMDNQLLRDLFSKKVGPCHQMANSRRIGELSRRIGEQGLQTGLHAKISVLVPKGITPQIESETQRKAMFTSPNSTFPSASRSR